MKQKYKSGDILVDKNDNIIEIIGHSIVDHSYLCHMGDYYLIWHDGAIDKLEKIGVL